VFHTDARLRPDGEKGLLVNTLDAFEEYYRRRAQLWEIQSLTRTRLVAGDAQWGSRFQELAGVLTDFRAGAVAADFRPPPGRPPGGGKARRLKPGSAGSHHGLAAYTPDWKRTIHRMRMRIEGERTPAGKEDLSIKTGRGGLMDAEFVAQALCLENGWREANTLRALEHGRDAGALPDADKLIVNYRELRRVEGILRRWSYEGETVLPDEPEPYYRVAVRCGFAAPEAFREALAKWRMAIREVYAMVFGT
jgi:glutamate-ammonia-ligase adenylyltransferase